jgi:hypothetical protein
MKKILKLLIHILKVKLNLMKHKKNNIVLKYKLIYQKLINRNKI